MWFQFLVAHIFNFQRFVTSHDLSYSESSYERSMVCDKMNSFNVNLSRTGNLYLQRFAATHSKFRSFCLAFLYGYRRFVNRFFSRIIIKSFSQQRQTAHTRTHTEVLNAAGMETIEVYMDRRRNTVRKYAGTSAVYGRCI